MEDLVLLGLGGHAHSVVDCIEALGKYHIVGFLDKEYKRSERYKQYSVIGTDSMLEELYRKGINNAFVTIGYLGKGNVRNNLYNRLVNIGFEIPVIVDKSAVIAADVKIGKGVFVGKNAVVNASAVLGNMCIVNTSAIIEHDCQVGAFSHIAVGAVLCGETTIGKNTLVGANSTVIHGLKVGDNVIIGAGTVVTHSIRDNMLRYGGIEKVREDGEWV